MSSILLDTSALFYWTVHPQGLSNRAKKALESAEKDGLAISSVSVWEIGIKSKQEKLHLGISFEDFVRRLRSVTTLSIVDVSTEVWCRNLALPWKHKDPADRTIVATAEMLKIPLVTSDKEIRKFYPRCIW